jgi:hypothetical protein
MIRATLAATWTCTGMRQYTLIGCELPALSARSKPHLTTHAQAAYLTDFGRQIVETVVAHCDLLAPTMPLLPRLGRDALRVHGHCLTVLGDGCPAADELDRVAQLDALICDAFQSAINADPALKHAPLLTMLSDAHLPLTSPA